MKYWLLKTEPTEYSWENLCNEQETYWDGVKNFQSINNMKAMKLEDLAFFYHSNKDRAIFGIVEVSKEFYEHEQFGGLVNVKFHSEILKKVTLQEIKLNPSLQTMAMLKQPRLSVSPVTDREWFELIKIIRNS
ncbi:MAG: EVE domain-containing protein [Rickettsiaceae bacterium H1]|nr:EVE domain-containing protein [Rickettsiaceae bacterium H1]